MQELRPCPFCGGEAECRMIKGRWSIGCATTDCISQWWYARQYNDKEKAIEAWNRRVTMAWRYDLAYQGKNTWETGFDSYDDAYDAMSEAMTEIIDKEAGKHPELSDQEIEKKIDWRVIEE